MQRYTIRMEKYGYETRLVKVETLITNYQLIDRLWIAGLLVIRN